MRTDVAEQKAEVQKSLKVSDKFCIAVTVSVRFAVLSYFMAFKCDTFLVQSLQEIFQQRWRQNPRPCTCPSVNVKHNTRMQQPFNCWMCSSSFSVTCERTDNRTKLQRCLSNLLLMWAFVCHYLFELSLSSWPAGAQRKYIHLTGSVSAAQCCRIVRILL